MRKQFSMLLILCLLVCLLPANVYADEGDFNIGPVSDQLTEIYAVSNDTTYQDVFRVVLQPIFDYPKEYLLRAVFVDPDVRGIDISFSIIPNPDDESEIIGIGSVSLTSEAIPGEYLFLVTYDTNEIYPSNGEDRYCVLTISQAQTPDPPEKETLVLNDAGRSLSLSGMIYINNYARIIGTGDYTPEYIRSHGGLLVFTQEITEENATYENASTYGYIKSGLIGGANNEYAQRTNGLTSREYRNTYCLRIYLQLKDGSYQYTELKPYGVYVYCQNKQNNDETSQTLKDVCQKLMEYGDAACIYFGTEDTA